MKIVSIVPGFGGTFYCGNCLRDSIFVKTLIAMGHESMLLPIYLPLSVKSQSNHDVPVFYGAVNIYLKQKFNIFRHMPGWIHRMLDTRPILQYAAKKAGSTRASGLEEMTISMLRGIEGYQNEELLQLVDYLKYHEKPDLVHLSNALLLGLAETIRRELKIPVICSLQDEDVWVDAMRPSYHWKIWDLMAEKGKDIDAFIAVSSFYGDRMKANLRIDENKLHIVHIGVNPEIYTVFEPVLDIPVIGFLSRLCEENGLEILIDAFIELKEHSLFKNTKLRLSGGKTGDDKPFIRRQILKLRRKGYHQDVEWVEDFSPDALPSFFNGLTVLSVPVLKGEAFGLYLIESLASGIPVIQPALGAFPEIVNTTGGGLVYSPNTPLALAEALEELFSRPEKLAQLSKRGRAAILEDFNSVSITSQMIHVYEKVLKRS